VVFSGERELFLDQMNQVVPWSELLALVEPFYPKAGNGRHPVGLAIMLRTYFLQQWFSLSDPGMEEAFYESPVLRRVAGVDLPPHGRRPVRGATVGVAAAPDETTILRFRHLLEQHDLGGEMLMTVNRYMETKGIRISTGAIVDATIIAAPSSTKNSKKERDPAMHQTKKGNQWYFGAKAHIGVDSKETVVHIVHTHRAAGRRGSRSLLRYCDRLDFRFVLLILNFDASRHTVIAVLASIFVSERTQRV